MCELRNRLGVAVVCLMSLGCGDHSQGPLAPSNIVSNTRSVTNMSQPPVVLYAAGDIANCDTRPDLLNGKRGHEFVAAQLSKFGLDGFSRFFLALGDLAYFQGSSAQFANCYDPYFGSVKQSTKPSPGNHEYETFGASDYFAYFGGVAGTGYYSFNPTGDYWHVISGNSNLTGGAKSSYLAWLENDLATNSRPCTVVFWHYPRFSSGLAGNISEVSDEFSILYKYGVEVLLVGHDHDYERFEMQSPDGRVDSDRGVMEFVVGTGGAQLRPMSQSGRKPGSIVFDNSSWGVLALTLGAGTYTWQFVLATGSFADTGSASCHS